MVITKKEKEKNGQQRSTAVNTGNKGKKRGGKTLKKMVEMVQKTVINSQTVNNGPQHSIRSKMAKNRQKWF